MKIPTLEEDFLGKRFGRLIAEKRVLISGGPLALWICRCDCGNTKTVKEDTFLIFDAKKLSCGCASKEKRRMPLSWKRDGDCIVCDWPGLPADRYPTVSINGNSMSYSRLILMRRLGSMNSEVLTRHKCDNRHCVNPDHLEPGSFKDNMDDKVKRGRQQRGEAHAASKLTEDAVRIIRNSSERNRPLATRFGVSDSIISSVRTRRIWKHVV